MPHRAMRWKNRLTAKRSISWEQPIRKYRKAVRSIRAMDIESNPNVALCFDNIQIEGIATILGHPSNDENQRFREMIERHNGMKQFLKYKNSVLIKVNTLFVEMWISNQRLFLDAKKQETYMK